MDQNFTMSEWLDWLTRVRLLMITLILAVGVVWPLSVLFSGSSRYFLPLIVFWLTLGILHLILLRSLPKARWHGAMQVACDVLLVSALVYATGLQESYFVPLYLLVIIVASILFSRVWAFVVTFGSLGMLGGAMALVYEGKIPRTSISQPTAENLLMGFSS